MPPPKSANEAAHSDFETQRRRRQKSETGVLVAPKKGHVFTKIFLKTPKTTKNSIFLYFVEV